MSQSSDVSPLFTWRSAVADEQSGLEPTSRLVALALSLHMNERGGSCFPSVDTQSKETGLDRKTVITHLRHLRDRGWLRVKQGGGRGRPNLYTAVLPPAALARFIAVNRGERVELTSINSGPAPLEDVSRARDGATQEKQGNHSTVSEPPPKVVENEDGSITVVGNPKALSDEGRTERTATPAKVQDIRSAMKKRKPA